MSKEQSDQLVDMVALARENALSDAMLSRPGMRKVIAPAKVNLFLGIGDRLENGYHEAMNVLHAVALHDVVFVRSVSAEAGSGLEVKVLCSGKEGIDPPDVSETDNIAYRAAHLLAQALGRRADETIEIVIEKHIPHQAGLGGGSSDAAATIVGLCDVWGVALDDDAVLETARSLGSDVPFFLYGGCALFEGAGERFVKALDVRRESVAIIKPEKGLSTATVYAEYDEAPSRLSEEVFSRVRAASSAGDVALTNNLAPAAERLMPELVEVREWLCAESGVEGALLCGSGSSTFAVCSDFSTACSVAAKAQARGWWARATSLCGAKASVV